jgi:hypothetical protein
VMAGVIFLLSVYIHFIRSTIMNVLAKTVSLSVAALLLCFFLLNTNFYPQLLKYQGGIRLAAEVKGKIDPQDIFFWNESNSASFDFYTRSVRKKYSLSQERKTGKCWLAYYPKDKEGVINAGLKLGNTIECKDYEVSMIDGGFLNPYKRDKLCSTILLSEVLP